MQDSLLRLVAPLALGLCGVGLAPILNGLADNLPKRTMVAVRWSGGEQFLPHCRWCGEPRRGLDAWALWVNLRRRPGCRHCGGPASHREMGVELALALLLPLLWMQGRHTALPLVEGVGDVFLFVLITVVDLEHRLVLMEVVLGGVLWLFATSVLRGGLPSSVVGLAVGGAVFSLLFAFGLLFARLVGSSVDAALGLGDVSLAALVGLAVGWPAVLPAMLLAIVLAGLAGGAILVWHWARHQPLAGITMAYGPYLAVAALGILIARSAPLPAGLLVR